MTTIQTTPPTDLASYRTAADAQDDAGDIYPAPAFPYAVAQRLIDDLFTHDGNPTLVRWRSGFWLYTGTCWRPADADNFDVKAPLWQRLEKVHYIQDDDTKAWAPTTAKVSNLLEPLAIRTRLADTTTAPAWLDEDHTGMRPAARELTPMHNGLLERTTGRLHPHTPALFSLWSLPFDYEPTATAPTWKKFLDETFAHDPAAADLLQEYAGYLVSGRTDMHKALMLIGPPRAGKGIISGILQSLMGTANVASMSFHDLSSEFGLASLIGKPLAVVEDARGAGNSRSGLEVERLLNIIANDTVSVNRKNRDYFSGRLGTRMLLVSNEVPRLKDSSGAILTRFSMVRLKHSVAPDKQDPHLSDMLAEELPGIFNWALDGLARLNDAGKFSTPATAEELHDVMKDMAQPLKMFLDDSPRFTVTGDERDFVALKDLHRAYRAWADQVGRTASNQETFRRDLCAAVPEITSKNTAYGGVPRRDRWVFGMQDAERPYTPYTGGFSQ